VGAEPKRILLVRTDRLGDVILTLPMVGALRRALPRAHIAMLLRRYTGAIVEGHGDVDEILWYDRPKGQVPFGAMLARLREGRFDSAIAVYPRLRIAALLFLAGIPIRAGSGYRYYSFLFNRRVYEHRKDARRHELEYNLELLRPFGIDVPDLRGEAEFGIAVPPESIQRVRQLLAERGVGAPFAVLHPGTGKSAREWPREKLGELGARIAREGMAVVVTGTGEEGDLVREVARLSGGCGLAGVLTLKELAALLRMAAVVISHSTGPLHLAVAVGTPVVGLYPQLTAMSARRWGPYTGRSRVHMPDRSAECRDCEDGGPCACMESITVDSVLASVDAMVKLRREEG
jgi:heptosyltransferase-3